jgi:lysophospholipase L1-like esterase
MQLQPGVRLLFIGDSITDCGRRRPVGEGKFDQALGDGFVSLVDAALAATYPDYKIHVINMGVSGHTVHDLSARWKSDVIDLRPDWLVIKIGINDVWQNFSFAWGAQRDEPLKAYKETLDDLIQQARSSLQGLVLMTPYILEPNREQPIRAMMDQYGSAIRASAGKHNAVLIDTQAAFDAVLQWVDPMALAPDRVHVNLVGHMILARAFLKGIGYDWGRAL